MQLLITAIVIIIVITGNFILLGIYLNECFDVLEKKLDELLKEKGRE